jgi:glycosyltransferase involved in cell wall biosynthesis
MSDPVPMSSLRTLVDSADIGVALYEPQVGGPHAPVDHNVELMGYASGKVASYLHCGLPVVTSDLPGLRDLVGSSGCGVCVQRADDVANALAQIVDDYDRFVVRACNAFDEHLELGRHFTTVLARIAGLE